MEKILIKVASGIGNFLNWWYPNCKLYFKTANELELQEKNIKLERNPQIGYFFRMARKVTHEFRVLSVLLY